MAIRNIRYDGDDILRKVCRPVEKMDDRTLTLIDDMFDTSMRQMELDLPHLRLESSRG